MLRNSDNSAEPQVSFWARNPLLAPAVAVCAGIWAGRYLRLDPAAPLVITGVLILAAITTRALHLRCFTILLLIAIAALGLVRYHASLIHPTDPFPTRSVKGVLTGKVCEQPQAFQRQNRTRVVLNDCVFEYKDCRTERLPYKAQLSIKADADNLWPMSSIKFDESDARHFAKATASTIDPTRHLDYGDTLEAAVSLVRLSGVRNPGGFDAREYCARRGIMRQAYCSSEASITIVRNQHEGLFSNAINLLWSWRRNFRELLEDTCEPNNVPMMKALILGDRTGITTDHYDQMQRIGVAHIVTVSGLHIGFVAFFFYKILSELLLFLGLTARGTLARRLTCVGTMVPVITYMMILPSRHSTSRAAIIVLRYLLARAIDRHREYLTIIAPAAIIILMRNPGAVFEASFQLSFTAAIGLTLAFRFFMFDIPFFWRFREDRNKLSGEGGRKIPPLLKRLFRSMPTWTKRATRFPRPKRPPIAKLVRRVIPTYMIGLFVVSSAASISIAPILAVWFGRITIIGPVANCFVIPFAAWSVNFLLLAFFALPMSELISLCLLKLADLSTASMELFIGAFGKVPWSSMILSTPSLATCVAFYVALVSACALLLWPTRRKALITSITAAFLFVSVLLGGGKVAF